MLLLLGKREREEGTEMGRWVELLDLFGYGFLYQTSLGLTRNQPYMFLLHIHCSKAQTTVSFVLKVLSRTRGHVKPGGYSFTDIPVRLGDRGREFSEQTDKLD